MRRRLAMLAAVLVLAPGPVPAADPAAAPAERPSRLAGSLELSLDQAIAYGLRNNLDVEVERHAPLIAYEEHRIAWGAYDPALRAEYGYQSDELPVASSLQESSILVERRLEGSAGIQGLVPWWGAAYGVTTGGSSVETTSSIASLSPEYRSTLLFSLSVPVLRDFVWNEPWTQVKATRLAHRQSQEEFRRALMDTVQQIANAYWALSATRESVRVAEKSLEATRALLDQTEAQYEVGVVSRVEVTEAEAGVAEREFNLIQETARYETAQDRLVDRVFGRALAPETRVEIVPTDPAEDFTVYEVDRETAARKAVANRPELELLRSEIERQTVLLKFARNQRLPELDIEVTYGFQGISGKENPDRLDFGAGNRQLVRGVNAGFQALNDNLEAVPLPPGTELEPIPTLPEPAPPQPIAIDRRFEASNDEFFDGAGAQQWGVKGIFSIPIGNVTARHRVTRQELELRRARTQLVRQEQGIVIEIRDAVRSLRAALQGIEAAERRRLAAEEQFRAERIRLEQGESTPFDVLQRERDLVDAESQKIRALQVYHDSVTALDRAQGTILKARNIVVEEVGRLR